MRFDTVLFGRFKLLKSSSCKIFHNSKVVRILGNFQKKIKFNPIHDVINDILYSNKFTNTIVMLYKLFSFPVDILETIKCDHRSSSSFFFSYLFET